MITRDSTPEVKRNACYTDLLWPDVKHLAQTSQCCFCGSSLAIWHTALTQALETRLEEL